MYVHSQSRLWHGYHGNHDFVTLTMMPQPEPCTTTGSRQTMLRVAVIIVARMPAIASVMRLPRLIRSTRRMARIRIPCKSHGSVPWADYYEVHRNTETAIQSYNTLITTTSEILFEDMTALPATTCYYKVKACNVAGCSELSGGDSGYHVSDAPAVPDTITASDGTYTDTIYVSWSKRALVTLTRSTVVHPHPPRIAAQPSRQLTGLPTAIQM